MRPDVGGVGKHSPLFCLLNRRSPPSKPFYRLMGNCCSGTDTLLSSPSTESRTPAPAHHNRKQTRQRNRPNRPNHPAQHLTARRTRKIQPHAVGLCLNNRPFHSSRPQNPITWPQPVAPPSPIHSALPSTPPAVKQREESQVFRDKTIRASIECVVCFLTLISFIFLVPRAG